MSDKLEGRYQYCGGEFKMAGLCSKLRLSPPLFVDRGLGFGWLSMLYRGNGDVIEDGE